MNRNRVRLSLLAVMLACCLATILSFTAVPQASAATHGASVPAARSLGGINLRAYCQSLGYADVTLNGSTVVDWFCVSSSGSLASFSLDSACRWQYRSQGPFLRSIVIQREDNFFVATSGVCYEISNFNWGGINLRAYCQSLGYADVTTVGSTIYDWRCVSSNGSLVSISFDAACNWQYPDQPRSLIYRYSDVFVMTSVTCWGG